MKKKIPKIRWLWLLAPLLILIAADQVFAATLAWDFNDCADYYIIYRRKAGEADYTWCSSEIQAPTLEYKLGGLVPGVTYYFSVKAFNVFGNSSDFSDEVTYTATTADITVFDPGTTINDSGGAVDTGGGTVDTVINTDSDLFTATQELYYGTSDSAADSNGDGIDDGYEIIDEEGTVYSMDGDLDGDGILNTADKDMDGDGVLNSAEIVYGTNMCKPDTDSDGYNDGIETNGGSDPLNAKSVPVSTTNEYTDLIYVGNKIVALAKTPRLRVDDGDTGAKYDIVFGAGITSVGIIGRIDDDHLAVWYKDGSNVDRNVIINLEGVDAGTTSVSVDVLAMVNTDGASDGGTDGGTVTDTETIDTGTTDTETADTGTTDTGTTNTGTNTETATSTAIDLVKHMYLSNGYIALIGYGENGNVIAVIYDEANKVEKQVIQFTATYDIVGADWVTVLGEKCLSVFPVSTSNTPEVRTTSGLRIIQ